MRNSARATMLALGVAGLMSMAGTALAGVYTLDNFSVVKGTATIFNDGFNDGVAPPSSGGGAGGINLGSCGAGFPNCYSVAGAIGEPLLGDRAVLDTSLGVLTATPTGGMRRLDRATLLTSTQAGSGLGLRNNANSNTNFSVTGLWDLIVPTEGDKYGIRLHDRINDSSGAVIKEADDMLELFLRTVAGVTEVVFQQLDYVNSTVTVLASATLSAGDLAGNSQISLNLNRASGATNDLTASFTLMTTLATTTFNTAGNPDATLFNGEDFTRAQFFASEVAVPEPAGLSLVGLGLLGLAIARRRRAS